MTRRTFIATIGSLAVLSSLAVAPPAGASLLPCTDGVYAQWGFTGSVQECVAPGTAGSGRQVGMTVYRMYGGGGGGGGNGDYAYGGDSGEIAFDVSVPEGEPVSLYVGGGGAESDNDNFTYGDGGGGGGSSAIVVDGVPLVEAGGGGGAQNDDDGGGANSIDPRMGDDGSSECAGTGGNQDLAGTGGAGGPRGQGCTGGRAGYPIAGQSGSDGWSGHGGDGASAQGGTAHLDYGGWGWSQGGDGGGGTLESDGPSAGSGGGGGYGDGGGGVASGFVSEDAIGSGGGGGSMVRPTATGGTPTYGVASTGASEDPGGEGQIAFSLVGPAVLTEAAPPSGVTTTAATTHSTVDPNSDRPVTSIRIEYTTDPDFATGVSSVPGDPTSLPGVVGDEPVAAALTGLAPGTVYYYRVVAVTDLVSTAGAVAAFQTPITVTGISPAKGPEAGGTAVTITGTGFRSGATATVGGVACTPVTVVSSTELTCTTGAHAPATVDVVVSNPGPDPQESTLPAAFTYQPGASAPTVVAVAPARGPQSGGTRITITGTGFTAGTTVTVGGAPCRPVTVVNAKTLTCTTAAHAPGTVSVVVKFPGGGSATLPDAFTYESTGVTLTVRGKPRAERLRVGRSTRVVRTVRNDGRTRIVAHCLVNGHPVKRACQIRIATGGPGQRQAAVQRQRHRHRAGDRPKRWRTGHLAAPVAGGSQAEGDLHCERQRVTGRPAT